MNSAIEENKRLYWEKRRVAETTWDQHIAIVRNDPRYVAMTEELKQINRRIYYETEHYLCKYEIHEDDLDVTNLDSPDDRGGYADTMYRSDHFSFPLLTLQNNNYVELTDELPFPMPDKPVYLVFSSQCAQYTLSLRTYISALCLTCGNRGVSLPFGFLCDDCIWDNECIKQIYDAKTKKYNILAIVELRVAQLDEEMNVYRQAATELLSRRMPEKVINVECYDWRDNDDDPKDVTLRIILSDCTAVQVCREHILDEDDNCLNCQFGCIH